MTVKNKISTITLIACAAAGTQLFAADPVEAFRSSSGTTTNSSDAIYVGNAVWAADAKSLGETYLADLWIKYGEHGEDDEEPSFMWDSAINAFYTRTIIDSFGGLEKEYDAFDFVFALTGAARFMNDASATLTFSYKGDTACEFGGYDASGSEYFVEANNVILLAGSSKFTNAGTLQFESTFTGSTFDNTDEKWNGSNPPGFNVFLRGNAVFENSGTVSAVPDNYVEYIGVNLFENAKLVNAEGGNIKGMELTLYGNATFENAGTLNNYYNSEGIYITLRENAKLVNTGTIKSDKYNFGFDPYGSAGTAKFENCGKMSGADVDFRIDVYRGTTLFGISASFENRGTIVVDAFKDVSFTLSYDDAGNWDGKSKDEIVKDSLATYKANLGASELNVKNYGVIDLGNTGGIVCVGSGVKLTLAEGSRIVGGNVSIGVGTETEWCSDGYEAFRLDKDVLNIELTGTGGNEPLISGSLDLCNRVELNVSFAEDAVQKTKYELTIWSGELLSNEYYSGKMVTHEAGFIESSLSGTLERFGTTYDWSLDTATGVLTAKDVNIGEEVDVDSGTQDVVFGAKDVATFDESLSDYSGTISGAGEVHSSGTLTFSGDASGHTGTTSIDAGTFTVAESATLGAGAFDVAGTLKLEGDRTLSNATSGNGVLEIASGATVRFSKPLGVKTLNVSQGATLRGNVSMTHGADAVLTLAGTLSLNADAGEKVSLGGGRGALSGTAMLALSGNGVLERGDRVTIFENGTVEGSVLSFLQSDAELFSLSQNYAVLYDASSGLAVQVLKNASVFSDRVDTSGFDSSFVDWAFGGLEDELSSLSTGFVSAESISGLGGNDPLAKAVLSGNAGAARSILNRLSPRSCAAMIAMPAETFHDDARSVSARLEQRRFEAFSEEHPWEFFAQAQMISVDNDTSADAPTFDFDRYGVFAGADYRLDETTTVGIAAGAGTGEAKIHDGGGKIESDDCRLTVFGGKTFGENVYVNAGAQLGFASYDVKRTTDYGNATASADGWNAGVFAEAGARLTISEAHNLFATPYVGLSCVHAATDSFTESGSGKAAFDVDSLSGDSLRARIGCGFSWGFEVAGTRARLGLDAAYSRELLDDEIDVDVTARDGTKISEKAKALPEDVFSIGPTLNVSLTERASVYAGCAFSAGTASATSHSANVGFRMSF